jgi:hypothetical protein
LRSEDETAGGENISSDFSGRIAAALIPIA